MIDSNTLEYDGEDFTIKVGDYKLIGCQWKPHEPKYNLIFVHGLYFFVTYFKDVFADILQDGGMVFACDHIGHGRSPGPRCSNTIEELAEEISQVVMHSYSVNPGMPTFIYGHSMGGMGAIYLAMKRKNSICDMVDGIIADAPWISNCPQRQPSCCLLACVRALEYLLPTIHIDSGISHFSNEMDHDWVEKIHHSEYFTTKLTPRLFNSALDARLWIRENIQEWPENMPMLFLQGGKDNLVFADENVFWAKKVSESKENSKIVIKFYDEGSHMLTKMPNRNEVINEICTFIRSNSFQE